MKKINFVSLIKYSLLALMLLLPFLATMPTTLYYAFNEHADVTNITTAWYTAHEGVFNQNIFAWVTNSWSYQTLGAFVSGLGVTSGTFIHNLLAYWLTIIAIYLVLNIILASFTLLVDLIKPKNKLD